MRKNIKSILLLLLSTLIVFSTNVFAIDLNSTDAESKTNSSASTSNYNATTSSDDLLNQLDAETTSATVNEVKQSSSNDSSFILNIFIIVIGILLILLAIAILIRLKN